MPNLAPTRVGLKKSKFNFVFFLELHGKRQESQVKLTSSKVFVVVVLTFQWFGWFLFLSFRVKNMVYAVVSQPQPRCCVSAHSIQTTFIGGVTSTCSIFRIPSYLYAACKTLRRRPESGTQEPTTIPRSQMLVLGTTSMMSTFTSVRSLRYVIYPVQVGESLR